MHLPAQVLWGQLPIWYVKIFFEYTSCNLIFKLNFYLNSKQRFPEIKFKSLNFCCFLSEYCKDADPCLNGGSCSTNDTTYNCLCKYGFGGVNCEIGLQNYFCLINKNYYNFV